MRNFYIFGIILILNMSCTDNKKQTEMELSQKRITDSIIKVNEQNKKIEKRRKDSILEIEEMKVIGDIRFTMNEKETKEKIDKFIKESERDKYSNSSIKNFFIGNYEFSEYGIKGFYRNDKLYMLKIDGSLINWEKYDNEIPKELGYIKKVIELKYGQPTIARKIPERYVINSEQNYLVYKWIIGIKNINITIENNVTYYRINIFINLPHVLEMISNDNEKMKDNLSKSDKEVF